MQVPYDKVLGNYLGTFVHFKMQKSQSGVPTLLNKKLNWISEQNIPQIYYRFCSVLSIV